MTLSPKEIVELVKSRVDHPLKTKEMAEVLGVNSADYPSFRKAVKELIDQGHLVKLKRGRLGPPDQLNIMVGVISVNRSGTGFIGREGQEDLIIRTYDLLTALDGDKVMVRLIGQSSGREAAQVIKVLERPARNIVGVFHKSRSLTWVVPDNPRFHRHLYVSPTASLRALEGEKVVAVLIGWDHPSQNPEGKIIERLGLPHEPGVDMLSIMRGCDYTTEFPANVLSEAERSAAKDVQAEIKRRVDFTGEPVYTIDPVDAKDFDDAVGVIETDNGYRLGVHIADVSFFVKEGGPLDKEAFLRGNSVYLPGTVVPMLPEGLSNDVCSLRPDRIRLTHSAVMEFDREGKMLNWRIVDGVIKSQARLTYEEAQAFFDTGKPASHVTKEVASNLLVARKLAAKLTARRMNEGSLDFEMPEPLILMNPKGEVTELKLKKRLEAHRLVEEFMLAANRAVALEIFRKGLPFLYRVHDRPDMEKLEAFSEMMRRFGHKFPVSPTMKPIQFARFLETVKGCPEEEFVNELMLRSMQKAVYQRENIGHFGLAFSHYTHFTSPIRRYPDLLVHRLLRKVQGKTYPVAFARKVDSLIDNVSRHCSETERKAERAERDAVKMKQLQYMEKHIGDEFAGVITGVMPFGFFVRLDQFGVEGLVRLSSIDDDYYAYEEQMHRIIGRRSGQSHRLGGQVRVKVARVDRTARDLDLLLVSAPRPKSSGPKKPETSRPRRKSGAPTTKKKSIRRGVRGNKRK